MAGADISPDIFELEKLCEQLYNSNSAQQIQEANKILESFSNSPDCLNKCQILLDRGVVCIK
jgi:exportin-7